MNLADNIFKSELYWINHDKWLYGETIQKDPGEQYVLDWVRDNASEFRKKWQKSLCSSCVNNDECGFLLKDKCFKYKNK